MATLYELTGQFQALLALAEDPDTDPQLIEDSFEALSGEIEDKADGYAKVRAELMALSTALKAEIDRLKARKDSVDKNIDRLMQSLENAMILTGKTKFKTSLFSFGIQKNPAAVVMDEPYIENIPEEYLIPQEPKIDRQKIKDDLKAGKDLGGIAHLEQGESLRIR